MCPLVAAPNRGYNDYQRTSNFDTGVLWNDARGANHNHFISGILDVSRYAYLGIGTQEILSSHTFAVTWFSDDGGSTLLGVRSFQIISNIQNAAQMRIPNLGPFCTLEWIAFGVTNYNVITNAWGTNRVYPLEFIPRGALVVDRQNIPIGAGTAITDYPTDYYSGPVQVGLYNTIGPGTFVLRYLSQVGVWTVFDQVAVPAAATFVRFTTVVPGGAWRTEFTNPGAASNYYVEIAPSPTGST